MIVYIAVQVDALLDGGVNDVVKNRGNSGVHTTKPNSLAMFSIYFFSKSFD